MNFTACLVLGEEGLAASTYVGCKNLNTSMDPSPLAFPKKIAGLGACLCAQCCQ